MIGSVFSYIANLFAWIWVGLWAKDKEEAKELLQEWKKLNK